MNRIRLAAKKTVCNVTIVKESRKGFIPETKKFYKVIAFKTKGKSSETNSMVSKEFRANTGVNIWVQPFKDQKSRDLINFSRVFVKNIFKRAGSTIKESEKKRVMNLAQAIIRNPMLRGDYGLRIIRQGAKVRSIFTGQLFQSIKAVFNGR